MTPQLYEHIGKGHLWVRDIVLLQNFLNTIACSPKIMTWHRGKNMVRDLKLQTAVKPIVNSVAINVNSRF